MIKNQKGGGVFWIIFCIVVLALLFLLFFGRLFLVGFTVNRGIGNAKVDSQKRMEVQLIVKTLEEHFDVTSKSYPPLQSSWFSDNKIPNDKAYSGIPTTTVTNFKICTKLELQSSPYCLSSSYK